MTPPSSPWLQQLNRTRPLASLPSQHRSEIAIIGGGIAGVMTAYYILKNTDKHVTLIEAGKVAHGATGHNAGQLVSYFERPFSSIVKEFGLEMAAAAQRGVESAWTLLDEIAKEVPFSAPLTQFIGYAGCRDFEGVMVNLRNNALRTKAGFAPPLMMIARTAPFVKRIPRSYASLYTLVAHKEVLGLLETKDRSFVAALPSRKGCMNSAVFCEDVIKALTQHYDDRFALAENMPVKKIILRKRSAILMFASGQSMSVGRVILCTNGFERITIVNRAGRAVNTKFHKMVRGSVGYMASFREPIDAFEPTAVSYLPRTSRNTRAYDSPPYFYLTRRPFTLKKGDTHNLVCIGGPEELMDNTNQYHKGHQYSQEAHERIDGFVKDTYKHAPKKIEYTHRWHGLMGYTPNELRCIGPEPRNPVLYYNLGCNGVGILPSVYGGHRISLFLSDTPVEPSIFDPQGIQYIASRTEEVSIPPWWWSIKSVPVVALILLCVAGVILFVI